LSDRPNIPPPPIGLFIRDKRRELGLSQGELARRCGISQGSLSKLERGLESEQLASRVLSALTAAKRSIEARARMIEASA
jgi:transcriptional regulator with XRE-family HTH domain